MLNGFTKVFIALTNTDGFITVLHVFTLKSFYLIFLLLFLLFHDKKLALKIVVLCVLLLDPELSTGYLTIHLLYLPGYAFDLRDKALSGFDFFVLDLILYVLFVILEQMNLGL